MTEIPEPQHQEQAGRQSVAAPISASPARPLSRVFAQQAMIGVFVTLPIMATVALLLFAFTSVRNDINQLRTTVEARFIARDFETNAKFDEVNAKFDEVNAKFDEVNARIDEVETTLEAKIDAVEEKLETKIDALDTKIDEMNLNLTALIAALGMTEAVESSIAGGR